MLVFYISMFLYILSTIPRFYSSKKDHDLIYSLVKDNPFYRKHIVKLIGQDLARTIRYVYKGPVDRGLMDHLESKTN